MRIPDTINELGMAEAFRFYRDTFSWHVFPAKVAGKKPAVTKWWEFEPRDCNVEQFFNPTKCHNIAVCPKGNLKIVDLDAKDGNQQTALDFVASKPELTTVPCHLTQHGAHLFFLDADIPVWRNANGSRYHERLVAYPTPNVKAEFFHSDHTYVIIPPSVHPLGGTYIWRTFGEIPVDVAWDWFKETFAFQEPEIEKKAGGTKRTAAWYLHFKGDLKTLNILALLEALLIPTHCINADEGKYVISCPWANEHTGGNEDNTADTSTVIWQLPGQWPSFKCLHAHCAEKGLQHLLEWAESKDPGIVDKHCSRSRVFREGTTDDAGRPQILHPGFGRLESVVASQIGDAMRPHDRLFARGNAVVRIQEVDSGVIYTKDDNPQAKITARTVGFGELDGSLIKSIIEDYVVPGVLVPDGNGDFEFKPTSFPNSFCSNIVSSQQFLRKLKPIWRILTVPVPFRAGRKLVYPTPGYDERLGTFLIRSAPVIQPEMPLSKAIDVIRRIHAEFCFANEQSRINAIARLFTPFARAILGWTTRVPFWFFGANRPRAGKDYLAAITLIVFEGYAFEDQTIGRNSEETAKRIIAAARNGRRFFHPSNLQGHLQDPVLMAAITNEIITARMLGGTEASNDASLPNEMEYSASGNCGMTYREDYGPRMIRIELAFYQEDPNSRTFKNVFLHETIKENRGLILSAIASIFDNWAAKGFPEGPTPFTTYPNWAKVIGGVMMAAGLGDPCLPFESNFSAAGGDRKTRAVAELFRVCYQRIGDMWVPKKDIYKCVQEEMNGDDGNDALDWFGDPDDEKSAKPFQTKLGRCLHEFRDCVFGGVKLRIQEKWKSQKDLFIFQKDAPETSETPQSESKTANSPSPSEASTSHLESTSKASYAGKKKNPDDIKHTSFGFLYPNMELAAEVGVRWHVDALLAVDIETYSELNKNKKPDRDANVNPYRNQIRLATICDSEGTVAAFDLKQAPLPKEVMTTLQTNELIIHDAGFELWNFGVKFGFVPEKVFCTLTASRLLLRVRGEPHGLKHALERHLGIKIEKDQGASDWGAMFLTHGQRVYAITDVIHLHDLRETLAKKLKEEKLTHIFELEMKLLPIVVKMQMNGFAIDRPKLGMMAAKVQTEADTMLAQLRVELDADKFNPDSPEQVKEFFTDEGIEIPNTEEETLAGLDDPRADKILACRAARRLATSFKELLKDSLRDGRIHAKFDPTAPVTGRFSSSRPNLQNITRGELRSCFVASASDRRLIVADYSQIELRAAALVANDKVLIQAFQDGVDLHARMAALNFKIDLKDVTAEQRSQGKITNFAFIYGQSPKRFKRDAKAKYGIELSDEDAERFRENFFKAYPGLKSWQNEQWAKAKRGIDRAHTKIGRLLMAQTDSDWARFTTLVNHVVSGSCADLIKTAMIKCNAILPPEVHMVATVHDELVFDAPAKGSEEACTLVKTAMVDAFTEMFGTEVPVEVEAKVCANWGEK